MADSVDSLLAFWREQRDQMRQSETQRAILTNYILVLVTGSTGLIVQQKLATRTLPLALLLIGIGLYGAISAAKYHERAEYHLTQARAIASALRNTGALGDDTLLVERRETHYAKYPRLHRIRLHWLWTGLNLAVAAYGLILSLIVAT